MAFVPGGTTRLKYQFIDNIQIEYPMINVTKVCSILNIKVNTYRKWKLRSRNKTNKQLQLEKFVPLVEECWINSNMTFGYREIYNELVEKHDDINLSMVRRIKLKILKLPEIRVKKFVTKKGYNSKQSASKTNVYDDLVETIEERPIDNSVICTDTTEVKINNKKYYTGFLTEGPNNLPGTLILGYNISTNLTPTSVLDLLSKSNIPKDKAIIHSDRGGMYKSFEYANKVKEMELIPSMSKPYRWYHNHWVENVNGQYKDFLRGNPPTSAVELNEELERFVKSHNAKVLRKRKKISP